MVFVGVHFLGFIMARFAPRTPKVKSKWISKCRRLARHYNYFTNNDSSNKIKENMKIYCHGIERILL